MVAWAALAARAMRGLTVRLRPTLGLMAATAVTGALVAGVLARRPTVPMARAVPAAMAAKVQTVTHLAPTVAMAVMAAMAARVARVPFGSISTI